MLIRLGDLRRLIREALDVNVVLADEIAFIKAFVAEHSDVFEAAYIVGSWATQRPERMPDRRGVNTSDVDLMIVPRTRTPDMWDLAAEFEKQWNQRFKRPLQLNLDEVLGGSPSVRVA